MKKAKIIKTEEEGFANEPYMGQCTFLHKDGTMKNITIDRVQFLEQFNQNQLSKETQAQAILFEGQCRLNAMLIDNKRGEMDNCNDFRYNYEDFDNLQEEIQRRINDLK